MRHLPVPFRYLGTRCGAGASHGNETTDGLRGRHYAIRRTSREARQSSGPMAPYLSLLLLSLLLCHVEAVSVPTYGDEYNIRYDGELLLAVRREVRPRRFALCFVLCAFTRELGQTTSVRCGR